VTRIPFTKMQGLGNDFVLLDARARPFDLDAPRLRRLADRRYGVGCDQVLVIDPPTLAPALVRYRVFNADGSPAQHCGNGVRCVARYLARAGALGGSEFAVEIGGRACALRLVDDDVEVDMGEPAFEPAALPLDVPARAVRYVLAHAGRDWEFGAVSLGNPHAVFPVDDLSSAPVAELGARLQADPLFPQRVNAGFVQRVDTARIRLRVYERGVGETPACGTGACAAVAVGRLWGTLGPRVVVELAGGELTISWDGPGSRLWMRGPAVAVFEGTIDL
jgi:diaminopimelate epimerase